MPYTARTKDGIVIRNIPDDVAPDSDILRQRVEQIRRDLKDGNIGNVRNGVGRGAAGDTPDVARGQGDQTDGATGGIAGALATPLGALETAATIGSSIIAEPIAGLAGIAQAINPFAEEGAGARAVEATREALTFKPQTEAGKAILGNVAQAVAPVGEVISDAESFLGDKTLEATGSPALAAAAKTIPTAIGEAIGFGLGRKGIKASQNATRAAREGVISKQLAAAAPSIDQLKDASRAVYREIDDIGASLKPKAFEVIAKRINRVADDLGVDQTVTPKAAAAVNRFNQKVGDAVTLTELDNLRKVANNAAQALEGGDKAIGAAMIDVVDEALDNFRAKAFVDNAQQGAEISKKYRAARKLWGQARRSELIADAFDSATRQASGFENGLRIKFRSILNNKRQSRYFTKDEKSAMQRVVEGSTKENIFKLIGKFGFTEGGATNFLGGAIGTGAGAAALGPVGAVIVPAIGQVSKKIAQRLTQGNAQFADAVVRAGRNGRKIVEAYIKNTPKSQRSAQELSELLIRNDIDLSKLPDTELARRAGEIADQQRGALAGTLVAGGATGGSQTE